MTTLARAAQFALSPLGILLGYTALMIPMSLLLGVDLERGRFEKGLYWILPPVIALALFVPYSVTALAHLVMARSLGFRIEYFALGPLQIYDDNRRQVRLSNRWTTFGSYRIHSRGIGNGWKQNVAVYLSAGWLSTAIPTWAFTPIWNRLVESGGTSFNAWEPIAATDLVWAMSLFFLTCGSWLWVAIITVGGFIIPMRDLVKDRERVSHHLTHLDSPARRDPARSGGWSDASIKQVWALDQQAPEQGPVRPREWDAAPILAIADDWTINPPNMRVLLRAYYHFLDAGDAPLAGSYLVRAARAARTTGALPHPRLLLEAAYYFAHHRGDLETAAIHLRDGDKSERYHHVRLRAEAAIHLAEEEPAQATACASEALQLLPIHSPPGLAQTERDLLEALIAEAQPTSRESIA